MAGREEKSRYELLEISDPSTLLVRGENKNYHKHYPYIIYQLINMVKGNNHVSTRMQHFFEALASSMALKTVTVV